MSGVRRQHDDPSETEKDDIAMSLKDDYSPAKEGSVRSNVYDDLEKATATTNEHHEQHEGTDRNVVDWDSPNDPANPLNWSNWKKTINIALISAMTFLTPLASSMFAPGVPEVMAEFASDSSLLSTFVVSVYILGWALGPLVIAPLSEVSGIEKHDRPDTSSLRFP